MASSAARYHECSSSDPSLASPKSICTNSSSEDLSASATSPKPTARCLCSPTTHEGSFRCRLHRSSSGRWGRNPMPMPAKAAHAVQTKSVEAL